MKLFSLICAAFVSLAALAPTTASASPHNGSERTRVTYDRCGQPIFWTYTCVGRDHCGRPVFQWVQQSRGGYSGSSRGGYNRGSYGRGDYGRGRGDSCGYGSSRGRSGVSFHLSR